LVLPIGLMRDPSGVVVKDPDMAVQERLVPFVVDFAICF
jgi:hypothetical protein